MAMAISSRVTMCDFDDGGRGDGLSRLLVGVWRQRWIIYLFLVGRGFLSKMRSFIQSDLIRRCPIDPMDSELGIRLIQVTTMEISARYSTLCRDLIEILIELAVEGLKARICWYGGYGNCWCYSLWFFGLEILSDLVLMFVFGIVRIRFVNMVVSVDFFLLSRDLFGVLIATEVDGIKVRIRWCGSYRNCRYLAFWLSDSRILNDLILALVFQIVICSISVIIVFYWYHGSTGTQQGQGFFGAYRNGEGFKHSFGSMDSAVLLDSYWTADEPFCSKDGVLSGQSPKDLEVRG
ncbi:PREDICTED: uncharacterized protein LOC104718869 isoform X1 [Camelina sativa]|uniref:Uncharacterized protein LOC104718869 isoform X1 n=1 Tax=Camelina sativa TaxID=90675 RepID=A0ABM0U2U8_CAMSA|nr:PREDICTED: uncharacterized protein LOC104718869 isoform X1 [Camelina sativa]